MIFAKANRTQDFLKKWIEESSLKELEKLLNTITGYETLYEGKAIKFELYNRDQNRIPEVHTCAPSIEFSVNCPDYKTFREKLETLIKQSTNEESSGFQFR